MKVLGYILTAAAVLVGADIFVMASDPTTDTNMVTTEAPTTTFGEGGQPTPPPD